MLALLALSSALFAPPSAWAVNAASPAAPAPQAEKPAEPPFEPPPLEALKGVKWIPGRVVDGLDLLREHLQKQPPPLPDSEALKLRNTGEAVNSKIAAALRRLPSSDGEVDWDATFVRYLAGEPNSLNYLLNSTLYESDVNGVLYAGPFGFDWDLVPLADRDAVAEWSTSEDRMMDRLVLRDDITWSDGAPFTARDIEFSFRTIMDPRVPCPALRTHCEKLKGVKAYDDRTLVYFHKEPLATNVWNLNFQVIPRHIYEPSLARDPSMTQSDEHNRLNRSPITSGPYRLVSWKHGEEIVCERRPEWYEKDGKRIRQKPYFKTIRFRIIEDRNAALLAFKKGELDELEMTPDLWHGQTDGEDFYARGTKVRGSEWSFYFMGWNEKSNPFFKDVRVRQAMSCTFPHQEFLEKICFGLYEPAPGIFHPGSWMADPGLKPLHQDLERAGRLLKEAGWEDTDGDGVLDKEEGGRRVPFRFSLILGTGNPITSKAATLLKRDLEKLGVVCEIKELEFATLISRARDHNFQAFCFGILTGADPDTNRNLWTTAAYKDGRNYVGHSNPRIDELFERGQHEFDLKKRAEVYREIDRLLAAESPFTLLCYRASFYGLSQDLRGFNFSPKGPFGFSPGSGAIWKKKR
jgi:peptide/nickel transport system substrate-binding protein